MHAAAHFHHSYDPLNGAIHFYVSQQKNRIYQERERGQPALLFLQNLERFISQERCYSLAVQCMYQDI